MSRLTSPIAAVSIMPGVVAMMTGADLRFAIGLPALGFLLNLVAPPVVPQTLIAPPQVPAFTAFAMVAWLMLVGVAFVVAALPLVGGAS